MRPPHPLIQLSNATKRLDAESLRAKRAEEALAKAMSGSSGSSLSDTKDENDGSSSKIPPNFSVSTITADAAEYDDSSSLVVSLRERCKQLEHAMESSSNAEHDAKAKSAAEIGLLRDDLQMKSECVLHLQREVELLTEKVQSKDSQIERRSVPRMPELEGGQLTEESHSNNDSKARETFLKEELSVRSAEVTRLQEKVINIKADASALNDCLKEEISSLKNELSLALKDSKQARELHAETAKRLSEALSSKAELDASISLIHESIGSKLEKHKAVLEQKAIGLDEEREVVGAHLKNSMISLRALLEKKGQTVCHLRCETFISEAETASAKAKWEQSTFLMKDELEFRSEEIERLQMALEVARSEAASCCADTEREMMDLKETQAFMALEKKELTLSVELLEYTLAEQSELMKMVQEEACRTESEAKLNQMMQEKEIELLRKSLTEKEAEIKTALQKVATSEMHAGRERSKLELSIALLKHEIEERTEELQRIQSGFSNTLSIAESINNELEQENSSLKNELDLMKDELDHNTAFLSAKLSLKLNEVKQLEQELDLKNDELDHDRSFLKGELLTKSEEVKQLQERLEDAQAEAASSHIEMKIQLHEKEKSLAEVLREKEELTTEVASLNVLVTERSKGTSEASERCLRSEIASLKRLLSEERENDRNDRTRLENELAKHKEELEALTSDRDKIRINKAEQEVEIVSLKSVIGNKTSALEKVKLGIVAREDKSVLARCVLEKEIIFLEDKLDSQKGKVERMRRTIVFSKTEAGLHQKELEMKVSFLENSLRFCLEKLERTQPHRQEPPPPSLSFHGTAAVADGGSSAPFDLKKNDEKENEVGFLCHPLKINDDEMAFKCCNNAMNVPPLDDVATKLVDTQINAILKDKIVNTVVRSEEMMGRPGINRTTTTELLGVNVATAAALKERRTQNDHAGNSGSGLDDGVLEEGCRTSMNDSTVSGFSFGLSSSTEEYSEIKNVEESALELPLPSPVTTTMLADLERLLAVSSSSPKGTENIQSSSRRRLSVHRGRDEQPKEETLEFGSSMNEQEQLINEQERTNGMNGGGSNETAELMSCSGTPLDSSELRLFEPEFVLENKQHDEPELLGGDSIISSLFSSEKSGGGKLNGGPQRWKDRAVHLSMTMSPPSVSSSHRKSSRPWRKKLRSAFRFWGLFSTKSSNNSEGLSLYHSSSSGGTTDNGESSGYDYSQSEEEGINSSSIRYSDDIRKKSERDDEEQQFKSCHSKYATRVTPQLRRKEVTRPSPPTDHSGKSKIGAIDGPSPHSYVWVEVDKVAAGLSATTALQEPRPKRRKSGIVDEQDSDAVVSAEVVQSPDPLSPSVCTTEAGDQVVLHLI